MSTKIKSPDEYNTVTRQSAGNVIVKCGASWCAPCKQIAPIYEKLAQRYPSVQFYTIEIDEVPNFEDARTITSVPTFLLFSGGRLTETIIGANMRNVEVGISHIINIGAHNK